MVPSHLIGLATSIYFAARAAKLKIVTAESCTGGLIAGTLTSTPGSSGTFDCGFVVYSNEAKTALLGVPAEVIKRHGAVSEPVARAMAEGALKRARTGVAVSCTGIAGPGGGTEDKPVGLVHIAAAREGHPTVHAEHRFGQVGREEVRLKAVEAALMLLRQPLLA